MKTALQNRDLKKGLEWGRKGLVFLRKFGASLLVRARERKLPKFFEAAAFLTNLVTVMALRSVSLALADYEGRQTLHVASLAAIFFLAAILLWEAFCLLVRFLDWIMSHTIIGPKVSALIETKKFWWLAGAAVFLVVLLVAIVSHFRYSTHYYASLTEIYGVPNGAGEPLSRAERRHLTGYWKVVDHPGQKRMTLSYQDDYEQLEFMRHYSSAYGMELFQPPARIEVDYQITEDKNFYRRSGWEAFSLAKSYNFREPVRIRYRGSGGNLLLEMEQSDRGLMEITAYASEEQPQLFNSTLLLFPEGEEDTEDDTSVSRQIEVFYGADSLPAEGGLAFQQIETQYNSSGLPETRRLSPRVYNRYGVNGESYSYDAEGRLASLCYLDTQGEPICNKLGIMTITFHYDLNGRLSGLRYYSDRDRREKTEGFHGVFFEDIHYNDKGQLEYRRQKDRNENWCQDQDGVYRYDYQYDDATGQLLKENFLDIGDLPVRNRRFSSTWIEFSMTKSFLRGIRELKISLEPTSVAAEEEASVPKQPQPDLPDGPESLLKKFWETEGEGAVPLGGEEGDGLSLVENNGAEETRLSLGGDNGGSLGSGEEGTRETFQRAYTAICHEFKNGAVRRIRYLNLLGQSVPNEQGCEEIRLERDQGRLGLESYRDADGNPCLIRGGYAAVRRVYEDGELRRLEYLGTENEAVTNRLLGYAAVEYLPEIQGGQKTVRERYTDPQGALTKLSDLGCASVERIYNTSGQLISETYYDKNDQPARRTGYGVFQILYEYADDGNLILEQYKDASGRPVNRLDTGYAAIHWSFEKGLMTLKSFEGYQQYGTLRPVAEKETGAASVSYQYENGRQVQVRYFGVNGEPVIANQYGYASRRSEYENGRLSARYYYGLDEKLLARNDSGCAVIRYSYDNQGRTESVRFYGENQEPVIHNEYGCAGFRYEYDSDGNQSKTFYTGLDGKDMLRGQGYGIAGVERKYDNKGVFNGESYFDLDGNPALWKERGYASFKYEFYDDGSKKSVHYYDENGAPVRRRDQDYGFAAIVYTYDDKGRLESECFKDEEDKPVLSPYYQCAGLFHGYDDEGREKLLRYLGKNGTAMIRPDRGFAEIHKEYDAQGNLFSESYFAVDGITPVLYKGRGYASFEDLYENGRCVENRYYGVGHALTIRTDRGYAMAKHWYNDAGLLEKTLYYDKSEQPAISWHYRCAGFSYEYDQRGRESMVRFLGADGKAMLRSGYCDAAIRKSYDGAGNLIGEAYLDLEGKPAVWSERGYASYTQLYRGGKQMETRYFDAQGDPVLRKDTGVAVILFEYDDLGRKSAERYYGKDGKPIIHKENLCAGFQYGYDDSWNQTDLFYLHPEGGVMIREDKGFAHIYSEFDPLGQEVDTWYYYYEDAKTKKPAAVKDGGYYQIHRDFFPEKLGKRIVYNYLNDEGDPMLRTDDGNAACQCEYNEFGQLIRESYLGLAEEPGEKPPLVIRRSIGCAGFVYHYDTRGNHTDTQYLSPDGGYMVRPDLGYCHVHMEYDQLDHLKEKRFYLDENSLRPAVSIKDGYSWAFFRYDEQENLLAVNYFGPDDQPILREDFGAAWMGYEYDAFGNQRTARYSGKEGLDIYTSWWRCAGFRFEYDQWGNCTDTWYLGLDGYPMVRKGDGCAHKHSEYDAEGNEVLREYFDEEEKPVYYAREGYSSFKSRYQDGNCVYRQYFDLAGKPVTLQAGYAAYKVDIQKDFTETQYLDTKDQLVVREGDYAILRQEFDLLGREVSKVYLDKDRQMVLHKTEGCAGYRYGYDDHGNRSDIWYLDPDGEPMALEGQGVAHIQTVYNSAGQEVEERFFDAEKKPVPHGEYGYAVKKTIYNEDDGNLYQVLYLDTEGNRYLRTDTGCAEERYSYYEDGRLSSVWYYGLEKDDLVIHKKEGYAGVSYHYDEEEGKSKTTYYYGTDGEVAPQEKTGVECYYEIYDDFHHTVWAKYYLWDKDSGHELTIRKDEGYAIIHYLYEGELLREVTYLDAQNQPMIYGKYGYASVENVYDSNGQLERKIFRDDKGQLCDGIQNFAVEEYRYDDPRGVQTKRYMAQEWLELTASSGEG